MYDRFVEGLERQSQQMLTEPEEEVYIEEAINEEDDSLMNPQPVLLEKGSNSEKLKAPINESIHMQDNSE
jgi:hypothetical protein